MLVYQRVPSVPKSGRNKDRNSAWSLSGFGHRKAGHLRWFSKHHIWLVIHMDTSHKHCKHHNITIYHHMDIYINIYMYMYAYIYRYPLFRDDFPNQTSFSIVEWDPCDQHRVRRWGVVGREHVSKVTTYPNAETRRQQTIQSHGRPFKHTIYNQILVSSSKRS